MIPPLDPALPEDVRQALALVRAHVVGDEEGWEALRSVDDLAVLSNTLVRIVGVAVQVMIPAEARHNRFLEPAAVDAVLSVLAFAFRPKDVP